MLSVFSQPDILFQISSTANELCVRAMLRIFAFSLLTYFVPVLQAVSVVMTHDGAFLCITNRGEGDCLFQALSQQLEVSPLALRRAAVSYMRNNLDVFGAQLIELGRSMEVTGEIPYLPEVEIPATVLDVLSLPWTWGGAECIAAIASHLQRRIVVYQEDGPSVPFTPHAVLEDEPLRIMHRFGSRGSSAQRTHYEAITQVSCLKPSLLAYRDFLVSQATY